MFFFFVCTSSHCVSVNSQVVPTLLDGSLAEMQHSSTAPSTSNVGAAAAATGVANRSFINKPARGWLHSDVVIVREGITYLVRVSWPTSPSPSPPRHLFVCVCVWLGATGAPTDRRFSFGLWIDQPSMSTPHPPLLQHCRLCFPSRIRNIVQVVISDVRRGTRQLLPGGWTLFFWGGEGGHRTGTVARCFTFFFCRFFALTNGSTRERCVRALAYVSCLVDRGAAVDRGRYGSIQFGIFRHRDSSPHNAHFSSQATTLPASSAPSRLPRAPSAGRSI